MKLKYALTLLTILLVSQTCRAQDPVISVYRFSSRPPADIFAHGFQAAGGNVDLLRFASGASLADQTSAYVATTSSIEFALDLFRRFHQYHPGTEVFLYTIRPTLNFHSLSVSLHRAATILPDVEARHEAQTLLISGRRYHEWAAYGGITPDLIESAYRLRIFDGTIQRSELERNPNYFYLPPIVNLNPLPVRNAIDRLAEVAAGHDNMFLMPAALNNMGCDRAPQNLEAAWNDSCMPSRKLSIRALHAKKIARMIASNLLPNRSPI